MLKKVMANKTLLYSIILFLFVFLFSLLIPLGGDDWGNYLRKENTIGEIFEIAKNFYFSFEGRFFSRLAVSTIIPHPIIWAILNGFMVSILFYMIAKILNLKHNNYLLLLMAILLFVDAQTYAQIYVWKTGNVTYLIPTVFAVFLIYKRKFLFTNEEVKVSKTDYLLVPFSLIFSMFVENVAVTIVFICLLNTILYYIKTKKIDKAMLLNFVSSVIGLMLMILSPGTKARLSTTGDFADFSLFEKIIYNFPNLINYTFIKNSFLIVLMSILVIYIIYKFIHSKKIKLLLALFMTVVPLITVVVNFTNNFHITLPHILMIFIDSSRWYICLFWVIFAIAFLILVFKYTEKLNKYNFLYFLVLAMISNGSMLISPLWGGRTAYITSLMLCICMLILIMYLNILQSKKINIIEKILVFGFIIIFSIYSVYIFNLNNNRNKYINYQIQHNVKEYEIIILPGYWMWNLNTWGSDGYFALAFKKTYGIPKDAELIYVKKNEARINVNKLKNSSKMKY